MQVKDIYANMIQYLQVFEVEAHHLLGLSLWSQETVNQSFPPQRGQGRRPGGHQGTTLPGVPGKHDQSDLCRPSQCAVGTQTSRNDEPKRHQKMGDGPRTHHLQISTAWSYEILESFEMSDLIHITRNVINIPCALDLQAPTPGSWYRGSPAAHARRVGLAGSQALPDTRD